MAQEHPQRSQTLWLGTTAAASRMGITTRTLYRFIDEGMLPAYKMGRVIRLQASDVDAYVGACKIAPGAIAHLYPPPVAPKPAAQQD